MTDMYTVVYGSMARFAGPVPTSLLSASCQLTRFKDNRLCRYSLLFGARNHWPFDRKSVSGQPKKRCPLLDFESRRHAALHMQSD